MVFDVIMLSTALMDVQNSVDYYEEQSEGLGVRFDAELNECLVALETTPFFQNRYNEVRCIALHKFPFMVHYTVDTELLLVVVHAVFHTSLHPKLWTGRKGQQ